MQIEGIFSTNRPAYFDIYFTRIIIFKLQCIPHCNFMFMVNTIHPKRQMLNDACRLGYWYRFFILPRQRLGLLSDDAVMKYVDYYLFKSVLQ